MKKVTIAKGDGIGPEIMDATLRILNAAKAPIEWDEIEIGEKVYLSGNTSGITEEGLEKYQRKQGFSESSNYNSSRRRLQKFERNDAKIWIVCQYSSLQKFCSFIDDKTPEYGCGNCEGK